jgi:hypothetical protein
MCPGLQSGPSFMSFMSFMVDFFLIIDHDDSAAANR